MTLLDYSAIEKRLNDTDIYTLIADCDAILAEDPTEFMRLLRSALSLSAHVLEKDKSALAHQLAGRLYHHVDKNAVIKVFVDGIIPPKNSLYPIYNGYDPLIPAGEDVSKVHEKDSISHLGLYKGNGLAKLDNGRFLSWSRDKRLILWDKNGNLLQTFIGHHDWISGAFELLDGRFLSWSEDKTLRLWDSVGNTLAVFEGHTDTIRNAKILANDYILSWSVDKTLRLWDIKGNPIAVFEGHQQEIQGADEFADGRIISWSHHDKKLYLWDRQGNLLKLIEGHQRSASEAKVLPDGRIVSWGIDSKVKLWDTNGNLIAVLDRVIITRDYDQISEWAKKHQFDFPNPYAHILNYRSIGSGNLYYLERKNQIEILEKQTRNLICTFYSDERFSSIIKIDDVIIACSDMGRVIFLRWVE
jgi:WD40 repeat protein